MPSGGCDFKRASAHQLTSDISEIGSGRDRLGRVGFRDGGPWGQSTQDGYQLGQGGSTMDTVFSHEGRLADIAQWDDQFLGCAGVGQGDHAGHVAQRAIQPELTTEAQALCAIGGKVSGRHEQPDGDGQVESGSTFPNARRCKVHDRSPERPGEAAGQQGGTDPVPGFAYGGVGKSNDGESREAVGDVDLDGDRGSHGSVQRGGSDRCLHSE